MSERSDTKGQILCNPTHMRPQRQEAERQVQGQGRGPGSWCFNWDRVLVWEDGKVQTMLVGTSTTV